MAGFEGKLDQAEAKSKVLKERPDSRRAARRLNCAQFCSHWHRTGHNAKVGQKAGPGVNRAQLSAPGPNLQQAQLSFRMTRTSRRLLSPAPFDEHSSANAPFDEHSSADDVVERS